jgi:hypothetical protein
MTRLMIVDAPSGKGHLLLFTTNPICQWQTFIEHAIVFNALMFWNDFPAEAPAEPATAASATAEITTGRGGGRG